MPRFKGINFWQKVIDQRSDFYSRALLTVPHHLSSDGGKRTGEFQAELENTQWERCNDTGPFQDVLNESTQTHEVLKQLNEENGVHGSWTSKLETYDRRSEVGIINNEAVEVVPSSNPESEYSWLSDEFDFDDNMDDTCEIFVKEDLENHINGRDKDKFEEVLSSNGLSEFRTDIPQVATLLSRLKQKVVKDPLVNADGVPYDESICFKDHLKLDENEDDSIKASSTSPFVKETFDKIPFSNDETPMLEEVICTSSLKDEDEFVKNNLSDCLSEVRKVFSENLKEIEHLEKDEIKDTLKLTAYISAPDVEKIQQQTSLPSSIDFLQINNKDLNDEKKTKDVFLETPLCSPRLSCTSPCDERSQEDRLLSLKPMSPETSNSSRCSNNFLRQFEIELLKKTMWQREKYFDEILALRLPEPDIEDNTSLSASTSMGLQDLMKSMDVHEESGLGTIELNLGWNPCIGQSRVMQLASNMETLSDQSVTILPRTDVECPVKYKLEELNQLSKDEQIMLSSAFPTKTSATVMKTRSVSDKIENKLPETRTTEYNSTEQIQTASDIGSTRNFESEEMDFELPENFTKFNPLDQFMVMRSSAKEYHKPVHKVQAKPEATKELQLQDEVKNPANSTVIDVDIDGYYKEALISLHSFVNPYLDVLKQAGVLSKSSCFSSLHLDAVRFTVKQMERNIENAPKTGDVMDVYKSLLLAYAMTGTVDLLKHCCLESAIGHLSAFHEKYQHHIDNSLCEIRKELFQYKLMFDQNNVLHPKVAAVCRHVEKYTGKDKQKVLVVMKRTMFSLMSCISKAVTANGKIRTTIMKTWNDEELKLIRENDCIITHESSIKANFKLSVFSLVLEFETNSEALSKRCSDEKVDYVGLKSRCMYADTTKAKTLPAKERAAEVELVPVTVIVSESVTRQTSLLQLLESRQNISVIERNYKKLSTKCVYADIIMNERHCIVIVSVSDIREEWQVEHLSRKLATLGLQYTQCWLVLNTATGKPGQYILPANMMSNIAKLEAVLSNLNGNNEKFQIFYKVLIAYSTAQLAEIVRCCCDVCIETSTVWSKHQWSREWLTQDTSENEKFLLSFPCINAFSAQILLATSSLGNLLALSVQQLKKAVPQLPQKVILTFYNLINCDTGLHLRSQPIEHFPSCKDLETDRRFESDSNNMLMPDVMHRRSDKSGKAHFEKDQKQFSNQRPVHLQLRTDSDIESSQECLSGKPNQYILAQLESEEQSEGEATLQDCALPDFDLDTKTERYPLSEYRQYDDPEQSTMLSMRLDCKQHDRNRFEIDSQTRAKESDEKSQRFNSVQESRPVNESKQISSRKRQNILPQKQHNSYGSFDRPGIYTNSLSDERNIYLSMQDDFSCQNQHTSSNLPIPFSNYTTPGKMSCSMQDEFPSQNQQSSWNLPFSNYKTPNKQSCSKKDEFPTQHQQTSWDLPLSSYKTPIKKSSSSLAKSIQSDYLPRPAVLRKPFQTESSTRRLPVPPIQRVSIGLAQPLPRTPESKQEIPAESGYGGRWLTEGSPPMDLEPDSYQDMSQYSTQKKSRYYAQNEDDRKWGYSKRWIPHHVSDGLYDESFLSKRKKLTYKSLPGNRAGQTVLAFR